MGSPSGSCWSSGGQVLAPPTPKRCGNHELISPGTHYQEPPGEQPENFPPRLLWFSTSLLQFSPLLSMCCWLFCLFVCLFLNAKAFLLRNHQSPGQNDHKLLPPSTSGHIYAVTQKSPMAPGHAAETYDPCRAGILQQLWSSP